MPFSEAAEAVSKGDADELRQILQAEPGLVQEEGIYDQVMEEADTPSGMALAPIQGTLLSLAAKKGKLDVARMLLESGATASCTESVRWSESPADRRTALFMAVWAGDLDMVRLLLEYNANATAPSGSERSSITPLEEATSRGFAEIARCLLDAGADAQLQESGADLLCRSISMGQSKESVQLLLERRADISGLLDVQDDGEDASLQYTPISLATRRNCPEIVQLLLDRQAEAVEGGGQEQQALLALTRSTSHMLADFVAAAPEGLEREWRAQQQERNSELVRTLGGNSQLEQGSPEHVSQIFQRFASPGRGGEGEVAGQRGGCIQRSELVELLQKLGGEVWTQERVDALLSAAKLTDGEEISVEALLQWVFAKRT